MKHRAFWLLFLLLPACVAPETPAEPVEDFPPVEIVEPAPQPEPVPTPAPAPEPEPELPELTGPADSVQMEAGRGTAYVGGPFEDGPRSQERPLPAAPFVEDDIFYFPLQFVAEAMGVDYSRDGDAVALRWEGHETVFYLNSRRFRVDGVEGEASSIRHGFCEGLPALPVDDRFVPLERDGVVFLPLDFLPAEFRAGYNSFGMQENPLNNTVKFVNHPRRKPMEPGALCGVTVFAYRDKALVNGEVVPMPDAPFPGNELLYVPLSFLAEVTGTEYQRDGDQLLLTYGEHTLKLTIGSRIYRLDGEAGVAQQYFQWGSSMADPADFVPLERDGQVFVPTDFLPYDQHLPACGLSVRHYPSHGMAIYTTGAEERGFGGYLLDTVYDELPPAQRAPMKSGGIVATEVLGEYDVEEYSDGDGLWLYVLRNSPGGSNQNGRDGTICCIDVTTPEYPTPRGLRVGDAPRRGWELYGAEDCAEFAFQQTPPNGPITRLSYHHYFFYVIQPSNYYITDVPEAWFETPSEIE